MHERNEPQELHGLMAEFDNGAQLVKAAEQSYARGYRHQDAYSPYPIHALSDALGQAESKVPFLMLCGGIVGALTGFFLQYITAVHSYPLNIGGRPLNSWPSFIPVTFEMTILFAGITGVLSMILLNGLPRPYHPAFNVERFSGASIDRFFLCIEATDPKFDRQETEAFLRSLEPSEVSEVEN